MSFGHSSLESLRVGRRPAIRRADHCLPPTCRLFYCISGPPWHNQPAMPRTLEPHDALRLLNGGPVALVTTRYRKDTDVMPAVWMTQLSRTPPLIGLAVNPARHSHDMIRYSEQFALNFPARDMVNHAHYFGMVSGREVNKLDLAKLGTFRASKG